MIYHRLSTALTRRQFATVVAGVASTSVGAVHAATELPLFDAHIHYSHDAWELVPPKQAVEILRRAGLRGALVSSSNDQGTQMLMAEAPDLIVPELRPYRTRADTGGWVRDEGITRYMEERLAKYRYVGVGEFHPWITTLDPLCERPRVGQRHGVGQGEDVTAFGSLAQRYQGAAQALG